VSRTVFQDLKFSLKKARTSRTCRLWSTSTKRVK